MVGEELHLAILTHPHLIRIAHTGKTRSCHAVADLDGLSGVDRHQACCEVAIELNVDRRPEACRQTCGFDLDEAAQAVPIFARLIENAFPGLGRLSIRAEEGVVVGLVPVPSLGIMRAHGDQAPLDRDGTKEIIEHHLRDGSSGDPRRCLPR